MKKGIFCCTKSVATTPKSRDHMPTTSVWGVAAKWPTRSLKKKLILCLRDPQGYSRISLSLPGRILKEYRYSVGFAKSHSLKCSLHKWAWCGTARKTAHLNCINLIHFRLTAGQLHESLCIVIPGVVCELLQFVATQFTEESKMATALTPQTDFTSWKSHDWWRTRDCSLGQPAEIKSIKNSIKFLFIFFI